MITPEYKIICLPFVFAFCVLDSVVSLVFRSTAADVPDKGEVDLSSPLERSTTAVIEQIF